MADIFISYKREEIALAQLVAETLAEEGFSAFFDAHQDEGILIGEAWDARLERELNAARAVIVLWSPASVTSENVRDEARRAHARGILFPARIDVCDPPLGLGVVQTANLLGWRGDRAHLQWRLLIDSGVARKLGRRANAPPAPRLQAVAPAPANTPPVRRMVLKTPPGAPATAKTPPMPRAAAARVYAPAGAPVAGGAAQVVCRVCRKLTPKAQRDCVHCGAKRGSDLWWKILLVVAATVVPVLIVLALGGS